MSSDLLQPRFQPRRSYRKSRSGCISCKASKVKCDEGQPGCQRCNSRQMTCLYLQRETESTSSPSRATEVELSNEPSTPRITSKDQAALRGHTSPLAADLFNPFRGLPKMPLCRNGVVVPHFLLLHHHINHVFPVTFAISNRPQDASFWGNITLRLAGENECVRNSVNAFALRDILRCQQEGPVVGFESYTRGALVHQLKLNYGRALSLLQVELMRLSEENIVDVIFASAILFFLGLASSSFVLQEEVESELPSIEGRIDNKQGVHRSHSWLHFLKGVISIQAFANQSKLLPEDSPMLRILSSHEAVVKTTEHRFGVKNAFGDWRIDRSGIDTHDLYDSLHRTWSTALGKLRKLFGIVAAKGSVDGISEEHSAALIADVDSLHAILLPLFPESEHWDRRMSTFGSYPALMHPASSTFRRIFMWPSRASISTLRMLQTNDPAALALYAHFLVFVILLEGTWLLNDMGRRGIEDILRFVDKQQPVIQDENRSSHFDVMAALEWPMAMSRTAR